MRRKLALILSLAAFLAVSAQPRVISHRGYWKTDGSAQNSIRSFTKADSIGAYGSEFDVWMTADGKLLVNHDRAFQGLSMENNTAAELRTLTLPNGEKIPTLDEYLALAQTKPNTRLVLEMKSLTDPAREDIEARKIDKMLRKYGLLDRTDIIAFSINAVMAFKKIYPSGVNIYYLDGDLSPKKLKKLGLAGLDYSVAVLKKHPEWVKTAHDLGLEVNVWTVNTPEDMKYFIDLGVDYITTDHPEEAMEMVKKHTKK